MENILENALKELKSAQAETKKQFEELYNKTSDKEMKLKIENYFSIYKQLETAIENQDVHEIYKILKQLEDADNN